MVTRKRMGFRPRKATRRMGGKANKRTRKNVLTGGSSSKPPAPPPGPAPDFKVTEPEPKTTKLVKKWALVNTSTGTPNKGASGNVNTSSMGGIRGQRKRLEALFKPTAPNPYQQKAALTQAAEEQAGSASTNREATMARVRSQGVLMFGSARPSTILQPAQQGTLGPPESMKKPVTPTGPAKVALLPPKNRMIAIQNNSGNPVGFFNTKTGQRRELPPPKPVGVKPLVAHKPKPLVAEVESFGFGNAAKEEYFGFGNAANEVFGFGPD